MVRHYYLSNNLKELKVVEEELLTNGFSIPQIHVLSEDDAQVQKLELNEVESVLKQDVVHSTTIGALVGVVGASLVLLTAYLLAWTTGAAGWMPFIFLAIVVLGFCTWEGGFIGIQKPNSEFSRFQELLNKGQHLLFIDADEVQENKLLRVIKMHPSLVVDGIGKSAASWVIRSQEKYQQFMKAMP